jgi:hypothetical protein
MHSSFAWKATANRSAPRLVRVAQSSTPAATTHGNQWCDLPLDGWFGVESTGTAAAVRRQGGVRRVNRPVPLCHFHTQRER